MGIAPDLAIFWRGLCGCLVMPDVKIASIALSFSDIFSKKAICNVLKTTDYYEFVAILPMR